MNEFNHVDIRRQEIERSGMGKKLIDLESGPGYLDPGLKVSWAKHHLRALEKEMREFLNCEANTVSTEDNLETGEYILRLHLGNPDATLGLIVGDFVSCLRGSLDHLVYHLTLAPKGTRNDRASFPILGIGDADELRYFTRLVKGVTPKAIPIIESLQPYHSGNVYKSTKLWRLHRLWNIDKHRRIPFHASKAKMDIRFPASMEPVIRRTKDGSEARFPLAAKGDVYFNPSVEFSIHFGDASEGITIPYEELIDIHNFVRNDVMPRFKSFF